MMASITLFAQEQKRETAHFNAKYSLEAEAYAIASLDILETVWTIATNNGYSLPERIKFSMEKSDRNALYFHRKNLKEIIWEYERISEFQPPEKSHKNNIYGLCHEMGHLCMYNTTHNRNSWMSYDYREGWADYFANMIVDSLYEERGINIWPEPHNFRNYAGIEYFHKRIEASHPNLHSFNQAGLFWYELGSKIGFNHFQLLFNSIKEEKVDNPGAKGKFTKVLNEYLEKQDVEAWFNQYADDLIINQL